MTGAPIWVTAAAGQALQVAILVARPVADLTQAYDGEADQTCKRPPTFTACDIATAAGSAVHVHKMIWHMCMLLHEYPVKSVWSILLGNTIP